MPAASDEAACLRNPQSTRKARPARLLGERPFLFLAGRQKSIDAFAFRRCAPPAVALLPWGPRKARANAFFLRWTRLKTHLPAFHLGAGFAPTDPQASARLWLTRRWCSAAPPSDRSDLFFPWKKNRLPGCPLSGPLCVRWHKAQKQNQRRVALLLTLRLNSPSCYHNFETFLG